MEPLSAIKAAETAARVIRVLFTTDGEGNTNLKKLVIGIVIGVMGFLLLMSVAVQVFLIPENMLLEFFLPESVREIKSSVNDLFEKPVVATGQQSLVAFPVTSRTVSSQYGWRYLELMGGWNFHEGVDYPVAFGSDVMSIAPGKVAATGVSKDYGSYILLEHRMIREDGEGDEIERETFYSFYAHLYRVYAFEGQEVSQRQQIALSGGDPNLHFSGNSTGAHLHLELRRTPEYSSHFDPYEYVLDPNPFRGETKSIRWAKV